MKSTVNIKWIVCLLVFAAHFCAVAQEENPLAEGYFDLDYNDRKEYILAEVNVRGADQRDPNAIRSMTGLRTGTKITLPGDQITKAINELLRLRLFSEVNILLDSIGQDSLYLTLDLKEQPTLTGYQFVNVKKLKQDRLVEELGETFRIGGIVSETDMDIGTKILRDYYIEDGYLDAVVEMSPVPDTTKENAVKLRVHIDRKDKVKIKEISFEGNTAFSDRKLRKQLKDTKKKGTFLKKSKYVKSAYEEDKKGLLNFYVNNGYSDARIVNDSFWRDQDGFVRLAIDIYEGTQYKYGNITWKGNSIYTDDQLAGVLGIESGDVFNPEELAKRLEFSLDGRDVSSLYMDKGYLFFNIDPQKVAIRGDSIDIEMRIFEGPQATIDKVTISGNDRTHENVIRRVLRTKPGQKFSRSDIVRSQREITNLGYFDQENLGINTPVNQQNGTVDIEYTVQERPADQLELSAGYGGNQGLIGTLGVQFNNFSVQNIKNKKAWSPLPTGDGQKLNLRIQSNGRFFRSYNFSFTEPWLGGNRPNSFSFGGARTVQDRSSFGGGRIAINRLFIGLGTQLKWPDDFFTSSTTINIGQNKLENFSLGNSIGDGTFNNFNIKQVISRSSISNPLFPTSGSRVSLTLQFTPPYSLFRKIFNGVDYDEEFWRLSDEELASLELDELRSTGVRPFLDDENFDATLNRNIEERETAKRFQFLEYHKWRFDFEWYYNLVGKLVMMTSAKMGFLGTYNSTVGAVPFERFELGGDGLSNQGNFILANDIIALRGYDIEQVINSTNSRYGRGGTIFNKFTTELRYPLSTNPNSTIYTSLFFQAGNQWDSFQDYNPFEVRRAVGVGLRVFLPMFGLLGFDYGVGLDKSVDGSGLGARGEFNIILGFEPD